MDFFVEDCRVKPAEKRSTVDLTQRHWLESRLKSRLSLVWTDNRTSIISVTKRPVTGYQLRLHHMFQEAPEEIWCALVEYILSRDRTAKAVLQTYINQRQALIRQDSGDRRRATVLQTRGHYVDLGTMFDSLNHRYFENCIDANITWMRMVVQRKRTSIRFGVYDPKQKVIRIHRLLDQPFVPDYFVESVVFHEMLHQMIPAVYEHGRWLKHPPAFHKAERMYIHYDKAREWERKNLLRLLASPLHARS